MKKNTKTATTSTKSNKFASATEVAKAKNAQSGAAKFVSEPKAPAKKETKKAPAKKTAKLIEFPPSARIVPVEKTNPRREGTKAYGWYALYLKPGMTVEKYLKAGGDRGYLRNDATKRGLIKIVA